MEPLDERTAQFERAVAYIRSLPGDSATFKPSTAQRLEFYGFFKQAKEGDCSAPRPSMWNVQATAKWTAWKSLNGMSMVEAMEKCECMRH